MTVTGVLKGDALSLDGSSYAHASATANVYQRQKHKMTRSCSQDLVLIREVLTDLNLHKHLRELCRAAAKELT